MTTALTTHTPGAIAEQVAIVGDLSKLSPEQRMQYYGEVCKSLGLNPLTRPFQYITLNGKLTLYTTRDATDQLRRQHRISISIVSRERIEDVYVVTARATAPDGRSDESTGVVSIGSLRGDNLANALMKAETKAKRRVTMSICGLGWMDESELETVRGARPVTVSERGEIVSTAAAFAEPAQEDGDIQVPAFAGKLSGRVDQVEAAFNGKGELVVKFVAAGHTCLYMRAPAELVTLANGDAVVVTGELKLHKGQEVVWVESMHEADVPGTWATRHAERSSTLDSEFDQLDAAITAEPAL